MLLKGGYKMSTKVWVTNQFEALHCWPEAPEEVAFLRNPHRHIFHVKVTVQTAKDREVEFFMLQSEVYNSILNLDKWGNTDSNQLGIYYIPLSCEKIAESIYKYLQKIGYYVLEVEVNEDNENGAIYCEEEKNLVSIIMKAIETKRIHF
jgi:hypothetical protein